MRVLITVAVVLASVGIGVGTVAADGVSTAEDDEKSVDLTDLLTKETKSTLHLVESKLTGSMTLIENILSNGVTL